MTGHFIAQFHVKWPKHDQMLISYTLLPYLLKKIEKISMDVYSGPGLFMLVVVGTCLAGGPAYTSHAVNQLVDQYGLSG